MAYARGMRVHSTRLFQGLVFVLVAMTCGIATPAPPTAMLRAPESAPK